VDANLPPAKRGLCYRGRHGDSPTATRQVSIRAALFLCHRSTWLGRHSDSLRDWGDYVQGRIGPRENYSDLVDACHFNGSIKDVNFRSLTHVGAEEGVGETADGCRFKEAANPDNSGPRQVWAG
jgi:hypothetical protein